MKTPVFDVAVIGGGINGCGITRDAAGRGLSVFLCEQEDLAFGTSSASTKLIHGGLRYLEYYEFRLVREALREREVLLSAAPHIIRPLRFILPHHEGLRPAWLIRLGLFLYDHIGGRKLLPPTATVDLTTDVAGQVLKKNFSKGFEYSDCWVMDSRLVVLNAMDAAARGAEIHTRTKLVSATRSGKIWTLTLHDSSNNRDFTINAGVLINASGPWLDELLPHISHSKTSEHIRMVKGSHIIVPKLFDHGRAYIFQNSDGRIIFAIPYENDFTLIGTTDVDFHGDPGRVAISPEEIDYLCRAASEYFIRELSPRDVVSSFSGIRPLFDDGKSEAKAATRDYVLKLDTGRNRNEAPLLSIYGGKITTYRKLAESVLARLSPYLPQMGAPWTEHAHLPGGDFRPEEYSAEIDRLMVRCPVLDRSLASRLIGTYGTCAGSMTAGIRDKSNLGRHFGADLYSFEADYLIAAEWAQNAKDVLWRRTRLGLVVSAGEAQALDEYIKEKVSAGRSLPADNR
ncbi:MAG: glycerol-3-phosphate dehydrogenase [Desulfobulbaceae bacterium BRH_c16a]|nr:MAG: glycerol-3-phosphate dehydrogenase [Desulfobulbaceae bacterium BRH_c16a]KJS02290.1 MAG: glycerol-3-phosphate dehydrogenase [Desulfobulbaceae bacterium BRH_c16a]